jgi:hypothetical protein
MAGYYTPPPTFLEQMGQAEAIRNSQLERRQRLMQLAENQRQLDENQKIRQAAEGAITPQSAQITLPPAQLPPDSGPLGSYGGITLPGITSQVKGPTAFDRQTYYKNLPPLVAMNEQARFAQQDAEQQKAKIDNQKSLATLTETELKNHSAQAGIIAQRSNQILQLPEEQQLRALGDGLHQFVQDGIMTPEQANRTWQAAQTNGVRTVLQQAAMGGVSAQSVFDAEQRRRAAAQEPTRREMDDWLAKNPGKGPADYAAWKASGNSSSTSTDPITGIKTTTLSSHGPGPVRGRSPVSPAPAATPYPGPMQGAAPTTMPTLPPQAQALVDQIGQGKMALTRLDFLMARNPVILDAVAAQYPDFDSSKVKAYTDAYRSFTSGTDSKQVNAGAVAMQHLKQLRDINDADPVGARTPGTKAYLAFHNLLDTVADELMTFYGEPKTNEAVSSKKGTLGSVFNRDAAIEEQANAMGVKIDELQQKWENAAPSPAYQAPMPGWSQKAKRARAALDPTYTVPAEVPRPAPSKRPSSTAGQTFRYNPQTGQLEPQ